VQRRRPVQQYRVLGDDLLRLVPQTPACALHQSALADLMFCACFRVIDERFITNGFEQLECHLLGQAVTVELELRAPTT